MHWLEEDKCWYEDQQVNVTVSYEEKTTTNTTIQSGATLNFKTGRQDDVITYLPVAWWNSTDQIYNNGNFRWQEENKRIY